MGWGVRKYPRASQWPFHTHIPTLCDDGTFKVGVMEEKVKLSNLKNVDSAGSLYRKYQELLKAMQNKDELISQLEAQLEKQVRADCNALCSVCSYWPHLLEQTPSASVLNWWGAHSLLRLFFHMEI